MYPRQDPACTTSPEILTLLLPSEIQVPTRAHANSKNFVATRARDTCWRQATTGGHWTALGIEARRLEALSSVQMQANGAPSDECSPSGA
jgi:hypothetical protein